MRKPEKIKLGDWTLEELTYAGLKRYENQLIDGTYLFVDNIAAYYALKRTEKVYEIINITPKRDIHIK